MMGQPDYLLRIATADADSFETLYMDHLAVLPHVQTLTSQLAMKTVKRSHSVPPR
jgi:DNA-binding Lrp family transcriptional regulator